jgi:hypothetical protein
MNFVFAKEAIKRKRRLFKQLFQLSLFTNIPAATNGNQRYMKDVEITLKRVKHKIRNLKTTAAGDLTALAPKTTPGARK